MIALRTPRRRVLGFCIIARGCERAAARAGGSERLREFYAIKLRAHQRTLLMMQAWRALLVVRWSDSSVAAYDLAKAIKAQGDARMIDDARAVELARAA